MIVTLVSNIPHYHYTAEALEAAGLLDRYYMSWGLFDGERPPFYFPKFYQRKLAGRRIRGVPRDRLSRLHLPELLQKALPKMRVCSPEAATDLNNWLFDSIVCRRLRETRVLHFVNTLGAACARKVRDRGGFVVCDSRQEHPVAQNAILAEEAARRGLSQRPRHARLTERMLAEFGASQHFVVPSRFAMGTFVANGIDPSRISIVPYGVEPALFGPRKEPSTGLLTILFVGTLGLRKGVLYLLEAMRRLRAPSVRLVCIGAVEPGVERLLEPYRNLFIHIPNVPKVELPQYYAGADVFVLPSIADAFPLVVLEAVMSGLPVVTTTSVGSCDLLSDGESGFIVPPANADALAGAIARLLDSESLRDKMSQFNAQLSPRITWDRYKSAFVECYERKILPQLPS